MFPQFISRADMVVMSMGKKDSHRSAFQFCKGSFDPFFLGSRIYDEDLGRFFIFQKIAVGLYRTNYDSPQYQIFHFSLSPSSCIPLNIFDTFDLADLFNNSI